MVSVPHSNSTVGWVTVHCGISSSLKQYCGLGDSSLWYLFLTQTVLWVGWSTLHDDSTFRVALCFPWCAVHTALLEDDAFDPFSQHIPVVEPIAVRPVFFVSRPVKNTLGG